MWGWMKTNRIDRRSGSQTGNAMRRLGSLCVVILGMSALTACDLVNLADLIAIGGEGQQAAPVEAPQSKIQRDDIRAIQRELAELGYAPGPADGVAGANTRAAIRRYQAAAGLKVDGKASLALLEHLRTNPVRSPGPSLPPPDTGGEIASEDLVIAGEDDELPPAYETGDVFAWSDGLVETVIRTGGDRIFWRRSNGMSFNADRNFVLPPSSWDRASGPGSATVNMHSKQAWPIQPGATLDFDVTTTGPSGTESEQKWVCMLQGNRKVTVPAGTFDTQVITCERSGIADGEWRYRSWFYAPAARHYVRRVDRFSDGTIQAVGLVAIRPGGKGWPDAARAGLDWAIQDALNGQEVGSSAEWSSTSVQAKFTIMPTGSRKTGHGKGCRTFVLVRQSGDESRNYPAIACQNVETGVWRVPVLDDDAPPASEVMPFG